MQQVAQKQALVNEQQVAEDFLGYYQYLIMFISISMSIINSCLLSVWLLLLVVLMLSLLLVLSLVVVVVVVVVWSPQFAILFAALEENLR